MYTRFIVFIKLQRSSWITSRECRLLSATSASFGSSSWRRHSLVFEVKVESKSSIDNRRRHAAYCRDSSSSLVPTIPRGFDARVVRKISFSNGCRVCDELEKERERKKDEERDKWWDRRRTLDPSILPSLLSSGYEFWFIEDIGDPWRPIRTAHCLLQPFVGSNLKRNVVHVSKKVEQRGRNGSLRCN